jgi:hypothetical protein
VGFAARTQLLGFSSSHRPGSLKYKYGGFTNLKAAIETLTELQSDLADVTERSRIVAMDQISFWDCGIATSSYGPIGGCEVTEHGLVY